MRRGDYGYDAPYALVLFGCLSAAGAIIAATSWWQGLHREAVQGTIYFVFFFGNAASWSGSGSWIAFDCAATSECSTWGVAAARC